MYITVIFVLLSNALWCDTLRPPVYMDHIVRRHHKPESKEQIKYYVPNIRRIYAHDAYSSILGAPSMPSHLPEAEAILPGHTLLRPALGMLKSAVKFPHRDLENGAGVNGNINNLGIRWDGKNERVLYTKFRRNMPSDYVMVVPNNREMRSPRFSLAPVVLDLDQKEISMQRILQKLKQVKAPVQNELSVYLLNQPQPPRYSNSFEEDDRNNRNERSSSEEISNYLKTKEPTQYMAIDSNKHKKPVQNPRETKFKNLNKISKLLAFKNNDDHESIRAVKGIPLNLHENSDEEGDGKLNWIQKLKNLYTKIKINQDAVDFEDFIPKRESEEQRDWWFYNQLDYHPLKSIN